MNEYYARDTSKKIRSVKKTMALNGGFGGSFAPYGYMVDPKNKRQLLVDPETAPLPSSVFLNYRSRATAYIRLQGLYARMES